VGKARTKCASLRRDLEEIQTTLDEKHREVEGWNRRLIELGKQKRTFLQEFDLEEEEQQEEKQEEEEEKPAAAMNAAEERSTRASRSVASAGASAQPHPFPMLSDEELDQLQPKLVQRDLRRLEGKQESMSPNMRAITEYRLKSAEHQSSLKVRS
jgi:chromosome segregation ATPase